MARPIWSPWPDPIQRSWSSWPAAPGQGRLRYPIAYAETSEHAVTGLGAHYSAPFKSDTERHGLAAGAKEWNATLLAACDDLLVQAIKVFVVPQAGARSLDLLIDPATSSSSRTQELLLKAIQAEAIPFAGKAKKRKRGPKPAYGFIVPMLSVGEPAIDKDLATIAPVEFDQLAVGIHPEIMRLIAGRQLPGYGSSHIVFDDKDALLRLSHVNANPRFPWSSESACEKCLHDTKLVRRHLDAVWNPGGAGGRDHSRLSRAGWS